MTPYTLTIPGRPTGKGRPRFVRATGRTYTPSATLSAEQRIQAAAFAALLTRLDGPVRLTVIAFNEIPPSWSRKRAAEARTEVHDQRKPDIDNLVKLVMDALNGIAWADDKQVVELLAAKRVDDGGARLMLRIEPAGAPMIGMDEGGTIG